MTKIVETGYGKINLALAITGRRDHRGIQSPGEEGPDGHVGHQLPLDGILQQKPGHLGADLKSLMRLIVLIR